MAYVRPFDPWRSTSLCTCPFKYTVNPYTGCSHGCLYCYASSYIRDFFNPRPKKDFLKVVYGDLRRIPEGSIVNISSSSDPYQPLESKYGYTRRFLELAVGRYVVEVVTKSDLVARDADLLARGQSVVSVTITTMDNEVAKRLEPGAPPPSRRVKAVERLSEAGVPVVLRLDPLIPGLNDSEDSVREVVEAAVGAGARHVVSSTYKVKPDNLARLLKAFPELEPRLRKLYFEGGDRLHGYVYAEKSYRYRVLSTVREIAHGLGATFAVCREGFYDLIDRGVSCDGTHLARGRGAHAGEARPG
ncbi:SPL family radical SAM protein [Thermofilum pendens]|uniref:Radical SAM domain protein n=1 Tax=Thermofilum pendens (strain DSM 2475 / Hrk 5) TaxID=368408 RepID=A1RYY1_THEPD|nr:radical SAM protein [Thermofilum pendens]ABL78411.1 Radical SAM domain protein [Thermofilum pendens Hrk 5]